jgi:NAD(P)-dependent dehydrogenase (short-subunit alcohol dehydrogenase family)
MSEEPGKPVWLITGSSSGLGLALTRYVLSQGHRVIGTSRNPSRTPELVSEVESQGGKWLALDATQPEHEIKDMMRQAESFFERIDVLVNNAAFCVLGALEDLPDGAVVSQMQTNFLGPLRMMQAVLPGMRKRRSGVIMNVSSTQGFVASQACGAYAASKFALEAISEACRAEVAAFGIHVLIIEPGAFRTDFGSTTSAKYIEPSEEYAGDHVVAKRLAQLESLPRVARGDPAKAARVMFEAGTGQGEAGELIQKGNILRVILGPDSWKGIDAKIKELRRTADLVKDVAASTDL